MIWDMRCLKYIGNIFHTTLESYTIKLIDLSVTWRTNLSLSVFVTFTLLVIDNKVLICIYLHIPMHMHITTVYLSDGIRACKFCLQRIFWLRLKPHILKIRNYFKQCLQNISTINLSNISPFWRLLCIIPSFNIVNR